MVRTALLMLISKKNLLLAAIAAAVVVCATSYALVRPAKHGRTLHMTSAFYAADGAKTETQEIVRYIDKAGNMRDVQTQSPGLMMISVYDAQRGQSFSVREKSLVFISNYTPPRELSREELEASANARAETIAGYETLCSRSEKVLTCRAPALGGEILKLVGYYPGTEQPRVVTEVVKVEDAEPSAMQLDYPRSLPVDYAPYKKMHADK